ncbi:aspartate kinase [Polycladomyces subterraneus]|uniref:Aspartokinase n=1 Tax=Polycladomyces subterraneus TaxID=1016997 RepID=A0ABT8IIP5_9BACL|nr:aspartate kinase [Polycladomyces subterraneus]MDN4592627.1 aspartate kinase [Polycladomyces subterraneus]
MGIVVQKFGGTSVGSIERIRNVARRIREVHSQGHQVVVTVSAMGKQTDELVALAGQITDDPSPREMDMLLTTGEQISIALLTMALHELGLSARSFTGWQAGMVTDAVHGKARIKRIDTEKIRQCLDRGEIVVVAGFQGISEDGEITTLGRGGSDTTAVALAAALSADYCEINTDVPGVFTTDPRIVPQARKLDEISFDEMLELANLGAAVLHPRSVECAMKHNVPLVVRSSFTEEPGTWVKESVTMEDTLHVRGIAYDLKVARIKVLGLPNRVETLSRLFGLLADAHINVDMIVQSEHDAEVIDVAFSVGEDEWKQARNVIEQNRETLGYVKVISETGLAKVSAVGAGMVTNPGVAARMFTALTDAGIRIKMVSTSEIKISCAIARERAKDAVRELHTAFGLDVNIQQEVPSTVGV